MASVGSNIRVKSAMAAAGNPSPRNPFTIPDNMKMAMIAPMMYGSSDGNKDAIKKSAMIISTISGH
jgi:hypothetical protein